MLAEHLVYTAALAIIAGMLFSRFTGRDTSWIIILVSYLPDLDKVADRILNAGGFTLLFEGHTIHHGTFHNIVAIGLLAVMVAFLLHPLGIRFFDSVIFTVTGLGAHLVEDALVYADNYLFLWPFSREKIGLAYLPVGGSEETYTTDFFHIANTEVLMIGLSLLLLAIIVRSRLEGPGWIRWYMPERIFTAFSSPGKTP